MKITQFFKEVLKAPLRARWSTGAVDHTHHRVFLRVWSKDIDWKASSIRLHDGQVPTGNDHGLLERLSLIDLVEKGYSLYAIPCILMNEEQVAANRAAPRVIKYDNQAVVWVDRLSDTVSGHITARIRAKVPMRELMSLPSLKFSSSPPPAVFDLAALERARKFDVAATILLEQRDELITPMIHSYFGHLTTTEAGNREGRKKLVRVLRKFPKTHDEYGEMRFAYFEKFIYPEVQRLGLAK